MKFSIKISFEIQKIYNMSSKSKAGGSRPLPSAAHTVREEIRISFTKQVRPYWQFISSFSLNLFNRNKLSPIASGVARVRENVSDLSIWAE